MKKISSSLLSLGVLMALLLGYNFMSAQVWTAPTSTPPNANVLPPINTGGTMQAKSGNFMANIVAAATSTWSPRYCDEFGNNCFEPNTIASTRACPTGQFMTGYTASGSISCATPATSSTPTNCTTDSVRVRSCCYSSCSPACPAGYTPSSGVTRETSCSTNNDWYARTCIRTVCS